MARTIEFEQKLERYAELILKIGVNLPKDGKVFIKAPLEAVELVRHISKAAYRHGALDVEVAYQDAHQELYLYQHGSDAAVEHVPSWIEEKQQHLVDDGYAFISIAGNDPNLLAGANPERVAQRSKLMSQAIRKSREAIGSFQVNWTVAAMATPAWAKAIFPDLDKDQAIMQLWDKIFKVTRADKTDPVAAWQAHIDHLAQMVQMLNAKQYEALHFKNPEGTDLTVGLAKEHIWQGGAEQAKNGIIGVPNIPTDEVFTAPHSQKVNGWAIASKPLSVRGQLIEGIRMRFENGKAVEATANKGQDTLQKLLKTDEGASRLGEVALVPASAPVAQTGTLFLNTLFDENAASHIALGRCYPTTITNGQDKDHQVAAGGNDSLIHVDWMIGNANTDVDGLTKQGEREALMRNGEWVLKA